MPQLTKIPSFDCRVILGSGLVSTTEHGDGTVTYHFAEERKALHSSFVGKSAEHPVVPYNEPPSTSDADEVRSLFCLLMPGALKCTRLRTLACSRMKRQRSRQTV